jgi:hypothetical protein
MSSFEFYCKKFWDIITRNIVNHKDDERILPITFMNPISIFFDKLNILKFNYLQTDFTNNGKEIFNELFPNKNFYLELGLEKTGKKTISRGKFCFGFNIDNKNILIEKNQVLNSNFFKIFIDDFPVFFAEFEINSYKTIHIDKYFLLNFEKQFQKNNRKRDINNISSSSSNNFLPNFLEKKPKISLEKPIFDSESFEKQIVEPISLEKQIVEPVLLEKIINNRSILPVDFSPPSSPEISNNDKNIFEENMDMVRMNLINRLFVSPMMKIKLMKSKIENDIFSLSLFFFKGDDISKMEEYFKGLLSDNN